jgi:thioredoxin reductase
MYDVAIIGGGPAGLTAALQLGRARRKVLLLDAGEPRNTKAVEVHGFLTRDGTPPREMRRLAHEELARYRTVERRIEWVKRLESKPDRVTLHIGCDTVDARRVLLATGMIDEPPDLPGFRELWGESIFQCPYCHGYEAQDQPWGYWARLEMMIGSGFPQLLRAWTNDVVVFTSGAYPVPDDVRARLARAEVRVDERPIIGLRAENGKLAAVQLEGGEVARGVLFAHPPQRQTALVVDAGIELDEMGFVKVDMHMQTSAPRIHAAGDLTTMRQSAQIAAGSGNLAGASINHLLMNE